jgi:hypothetical protein
MPGKIYWKYDYYRGGLGDFVRGALSTYAFCRDHGIEFAIWIPDHPLSKCFDLPTITGTVSAPEMLLDHNDPVHNEGAPNERRLIESIFETNSSSELTLITNIYTLVPHADLVSAAPEFARILRPSAAVLDRIASLAPPPKTYVSLHVRCGDAFMRAFDRYCPGDTRCDPATALKDVEAAVAAIRHDTDLPILFHTDNEALRTAVRHLPVRPLASRIQHTAQHTETGDPADYYDSVAEFFIIAQAAHVYYTVASGFPRWASMIGNVKTTHLKSQTQNF